MDIYEKEKIKFSEVEKRQLISLVKEKKLIWDKSHKLHSNRNAMKSAWKEIANAIGKPDETCRQNWKSILDSRRYYNQRRKLSKKSGSRCELQFLLDESENTWEYSEDLQFLTETSELRTTTSSQVLVTPDFQDMLSDSELTIEPSKPAYSYKNTTASTKIVCLNEMRAGVSKVADVMTTLVDLAKQQNKSENSSFLNYVDSLMLKLPLEVAERNIRS